MPLPVIAIAIPVLHSSGAWIASTAGAGYLAGTLSSTWIGAFVLGNSGLLGSLGLVSAAGIFGALGGVSSGVAATAGSALTAIGLGGVATKLGIAPVASFLGLTPVGWAITGTAATVVSTISYYFVRRTMARVNEERAVGGLEPITLRELVNDVKQFETKSLVAILKTLVLEREGVTLSDDHTELYVDGQSYPVSRLRYIVQSDGLEVIVLISKFSRNETVLVVKGPSEEK